MNKNLLLTFIFTIWLSFLSSQEASISFLFPNDNSTVPENFIAKFEIENFSIPSDGLVKVRIENENFDDIVFYYNFEIDWISFNLPNGSSSTLTLELVDSNQDPFNPRITSIIKVNSVQSIDVDNLLELRTGNFTDFYKVTNNTFALYKRPSINQTYLDDGTAGILMDDFFYTTLIGPQGTFINGYTELIGRLVDENGVLKFLPYAGTRKLFEESEIVTSSNTDISFSNLINNINDYESEIITLEGGSFVGLEPGQVFEENISYNITNGNETMVFKTNFSEADYIGLEIPMVFDAITGIVSEFDGIAQITTVDFNSINIPSLSTSYFQQESFTIYPNPANQGIIHIDHNSGYSNKLMLEIYDLQGQLVISKKSLDNVLDISTLSKGVYLIKIENNKYNFFKKLIIN